MSKILLAYPSGLMRDHYEEDESAVILDDKGWWVINGDSGKRENIPVSNNDFDFENCSGSKGILEKIEWWFPIFHRWAAHSDQYELLKREALFYVLYIQAGFTRYGVSQVLFQTSMPHHVDTLLIEVAASTLNIPQYFLCFNVIDGRLIPMRQVNTVADRALVCYDISDSDVTDTLDLFIENKRSMGLPMHNEMPLEWRRSLILAILHLGYLLLRDKVGTAYRKLRGISEKKVLNSLNNYRYGRHCRLYIQQYSAMRYYSEHTLSESVLAELVAGHDHPVLLIAAHFQPEATSFPDGGRLGNHVDIVLKIRESGYKGLILYKEHRASWMYSSTYVGSNRVGISRSVEYFKQLHELGCSFIPADFNLDVAGTSNDWYLPITISGTIGLERCLFGLHTIVTGHPWYKNMPGVLHVSDLDLSTKLDHAWCCRNDEIADRAYAYLREVLSRKTVINAIGVGNGKKVPKWSTVFLLELDMLIAHIRQHDK